MTTLAILVLVFWVLASLVFEDWKKHVVYPARTFSVRLTSGLVEFSMVALAIWVIAR